MSVHYQAQNRIVASYQSLFAFQRHCEAKPLYFRYFGDIDSNVALQTYKAMNPDMQSLISKHETIDSREQSDHLQRSFCGNQLRFKPREILNENKSE